jgi:glycerol-3-phosphate dehydrogenase
MVPKTDDGRVLFIVPWHGRALLGTTDTKVEQIEQEPRPLEQEIAFLMEHAARYLERDPKAEEILSVYVGLRPLVKSRREDAKTRSLSRDHVLFVAPSGLITIVGGKWTTYRKMAEDTVDRAIKVGALEPKPCVTSRLRLHGAPPMDSAEGVQGADPAELLSIYGTEAARIRALAQGDSTLAELLHPKLPYLWAEVVWAVREEMARTVEDVLARRTRALILDARASAECAPAVAETIAKELGRDAVWVRGQVDSFQRRCRESLLTH